MPYLQFLTISHTDLYMLYINNHKIRSSSLRLFRRINLVIDASEKVSMFYEHWQPEFSIYQISYQSLLVSFELFLFVTVLHMF